MHKKRLWHREMGCRICQNGYRNSRIIWWSQEQHLLGVTSEILQHHLVQTLYQPKLQNRKYNLFTNVPKDPNCERASVRKLQEQLVDEVHKVTYSAQQSQERSLLPITKSSNGGGESRNNQRYAVAVQDVANQQIQTYSCKPKNITRNGKKSSKVSRSWRKSKGCVHRQFVGIWKSL